MQVDFIEIIFQKDDFDLLLFYFLHQIQRQDIDICFFVDNEFQKLLVDRLIQKGIITKAYYRQISQTSQFQHFLSSCNSIARYIQLLEVNKLPKIVKRWQSVIFKIQRLYFTADMWGEFIDFVYILVLEINLFVFSLCLLFYEWGKGDLSSTMHRLANRYIWLIIDDSKVLPQ